MADAGAPGELAGEPVTLTTGDVAPAEPAERLTGHLQLPGAIALAITIVVGSGVLVLPGIAYREAGRDALLTWLAAAVVTVPLLAIFSRLGARYPGAGGVAGFVQAAFGRHAAAGVEVMLLGTFGLGIPAIAITGGNYVVALFPGAEGSTTAAAAAAAVLVAATAAVVFVGVRLSTRVQVVLAVVLTTALAVVGVLGVTTGDGLGHAPDLGGHAIWNGASAVALVFFAFTGWEMLSFTTEEYVNPRRDFPRALVISFLLVVAVYVLLAWAVQTQLTRGDTTSLSAPIYAVVEAFSSRRWAALTSVLAVVIIVANLVGATWGASRLVMSSAREGLLPRPLAGVHQASGSPRRAVLACAGGFLCILVVNASGLIPLRGLLSIAGQNFYLLYLLCALAFSRLFAGPARVFGVVVSAALATLAAVAFRPAQVVYAAALLAVGIGVSARRAGTRRTG